jgi:hypothetical protein
MPLVAHARVRELRCITRNEIVYSNNLVALRKQSVNEGGPDEPGSTCNQRSHIDQLLFRAERGRCGSSRRPVKAAQRSEPVIALRPLAVMRSTWRTKLLGVTEYGAIDPGGSMETEW